MTNDQTTFKQCLIHETKKAYKRYIDIVLKSLLIISAAGIVAILAVLFGNSIVYVWNVITTTIQNGGAALVSGITTLGSVIWSWLLAVPWWAYVIIGLVALPFIYAIVICIQRRLGFDLTLIGIVGFLSLGMGVILGAALAALTNEPKNFIPATLIFGGVMMMAMWVGVHHNMRSESIRY